MKSKTNTGFAPIFIVVIVALVGATFLLVRNKTYQPPSPQSSPTAASSPSTRPSVSPSVVPPKTLTKVAPTSTLSPKPTPTPVVAVERVSYSLKPSTASVNFQIRTNEGYSLFALLYANEKVVTNQKGFGYQWEIKDAALATLREFSACSNGIIEPCPKDHVSITPLKSGASTITLKVFPWEGEMLAKLEIPITISGNPPQMQITYPSAGQTITLAAGSQLCVVDVPTGGDTQGLQRRQNFNHQGWTNYEAQTTLCFTPPSGENSLELQYRNKFADESSIVRVAFSIVRQ